jgi:methylmalonyl-CoA mutase cobalamin-binding domain/chain
MTQATNGQLASALVELEEKQVETLVSEKLAAGVPPVTILEEMRQGMIEIGDRFAGGTYFLTELIMAAEIFGQTMKKIEPRLTGESGGEAGEVVFATVKGDIHDIGKNIVVAMLRGRGFRVHDLGVDVPPERIVEKLQETGAGILGLSALLTTSFDSMKTTVEAVRQAGLRDRVKIMVGGGPVDERVRAFVGADVCGRDAQQAVSLARQYAAVEV